MSAWTTGGNVPDATVRLVASPASLAPRFSFGCGTRNGTASCDLGAMDVKSSQRELQAQLSVPATATSVTSVKLTVIGSAAHLPKDPTASATVSLTAPTAGLTSGSGTPNVNVNMNTSPLSVSNLPFLPAGSPTLSPGGNAAGLFPTLNPSASGPDPASSGQGQQQGAANAVANTAALPLGASVVGAQLIGLGVLALAFVLAVTRLSIRKRPAVKPAAGPHPESTQSGDKNTPES